MTTQPMPPKTKPTPHKRAHRQQRLVMVATLALSDALLISLSLWLSWYLRLESGLLAYNAPTEPERYRQVALLAAFLFVLIFAAIGLYNPHNLLGGPQEYSLVMRGCSYGILALIVVSFIQHSQPLSRGWLLLNWALTIGTVGAARFTLRRMFFWLRSRFDWFITPTLIVGVSEHGQALARQLHGQSAGIRIVGFVDEFLPPGTPVVDDLTVLGTPGQIHQLSAAHAVEQIILLSNAVTWETFQEIMKTACQINGYEMHLSPGFYEIVTANVQVTHKAFVPLLRVDQARITGLDKILKLLLDYTLGPLLALVALIPAILIAAAIFLTDGRPIFVRHRVPGLGGTPFLTLKFRTGLLGTINRRLGQPFPEGILDNPGHGFRVGYFLYRTGLDKLPQLFDVLRGKMSLVGSRTTSLDSKERGRTLHPSLLTVKPGWTGPWAVGGARTPEDEQRLTLYYIRNWTIWLDLQILFQTFKLALLRKSRNIS